MRMIKYENNREEVILRLNLYISTVKSLHHWNKTYETCESSFRKEVGSIISIIQKEALYQKQRLEERFPEFVNYDYEDCLKLYDNLINNV